MGFNIIIITMNLLMSEILSKAELIEADITYETKEYPYLFNARLVPNMPHNFKNNRSQFWQE